MNSHIPEIQDGLRPVDPKTRKLGRSPYVAVFTRTNVANTYRLKFIDESSEEYASLLTRSRQVGTLGRTTARQYGWC